MSQSPDDIRLTTIKYDFFYLTDFSFVTDHETLEEGQRTYWPKPWEYNNEDENNSPNILINKSSDAGLYFCAG